MRNNNTLISPIEVDQYNNCPLCGAEKSIDLYDRSDRVIRYGIVLDRFNKDGSLLYIDKRPLKKFVCNRCKEEFEIHWITTSIGIRFPKPFTNTLRLDYLINKFN